MRRRGDITSLVIIGALAISAVLLAIFEPWRGHGDAEFRVLRFEPESGRLARNETISIIFDREIHPETPVAALIQVNGAGGRRLPTRIERQGAGLAISPTDPLGWPAHEQIEARVAPGLAVPFRARDYSALKSASQADFKVGSDYLDFGASFRLRRVAPNALVAVPKGTVFRFRADLPLDPDCFRPGPALATIVAYDERGRARTFMPTVGIGADGRSLIVTPWTRASAFEPGAAHRLTLPKGRLKAVTGRALERDLVIDFMTALDADFEGQLDISFAIEDLDPETRRLLGEDRGFAEPELTMFSSVELGTKEEQNADLASRPQVFGPGARRLQVLVPGSHLGEEAGVITGFAFFAAADPAAPETVLHRDLLLPRMVFRLGEASEAAARGLQPDLGSNFAEPGPHEAVAAGSHEGELALGRRDRRGDYGEWIDIVFERPFAYRGGSRDLVLEVLNDGGAFAAEGKALASDWPGVLWAMTTSQRANPVQIASSLMVSGRMGENPSGIPEPAIFATKIQIERYQDLVTRWYESEGSSPTWFRIPGEDQLDADGVEGRDFVVDFQGIGPDGRSSAWTRLDDLSGCRKIRARLRFLPDTDWRKVGIQVRRLRVRFRDGR